MFQFLPLSAKLYLALLAFFLGAVMGSALNCLAYRIVRDQKWSSGRSRCPACGHTLSLPDLIPVVSWLCLGGKCRHCGAKISARYVITEALLGLAFVSVLLRFGLSFDALSAAVLVACLLSLSLVDLEIQIIPDRFLAIPAAVRLIQIIFSSNFRAILPALIFGAGLLFLSLLMDKVLKKDSMGGGDIKLMAVLGLFFTVPECLLLLVIACIVGIFMAAILMKIDSDTAFPFGPALSIAAWVTLMFGQAITGWYLGLF